ncbi:MAG: ATP-binding protein [Armatimonadota bacterium]|nr:ATP-binding protein [Armatimonadota bacterium]MDR5696351.1 ATP-binding protein [Armatimonadota bacterium]
MRSRIGRRILAGYLLISLLLGSFFGLLVYASTRIVDLARRLDAENRAAADVLAASLLAERRLFRLLQAVGGANRGAEVEYGVLSRVLITTLGRVRRGLAEPEHSRFGQQADRANMAFMSAGAALLRSRPEGSTVALADVLTHHRALRALLDDRFAQIQAAALSGVAELTAFQHGVLLPSFLRNLALNSERIFRFSRAVTASQQLELLFWQRGAALLVLFADPSAGYAGRLTDQAPSRRLFEELQGLVVLPELQAVLADTMPAVESFEALTRTAASQARDGGVPSRELRTRFPSVMAAVVERLESMRSLIEVERDRTLADIALVNDSILSFVLSLSVVGAVGLLAGGAVAVVVARAVTTSLESLRAAMEAVRGGDLGVRVPTSGRDDETELMGEVFNRMVGELQDSRTKLRQYQQDLERMVEERTRQLREAQAQLVQSEKLSAMGELVAGVAHELNNPLTSILGYAQLLEGESDLPPKIHRNLTVIVQEADRARRIVQNLLTFARQQPRAWDLVDVNAAVEQALALQRYEVVREGIEVVTRLAPDLPPVRGDLHQLQQVFLNIVNNAIHAMRGRAPARLEVVTRHRRDRVVIEFADTGPGIAPEHLHRLFDPFFTTKRIGEGTGLGLSISYGIVRDHGGTITAANRREGGARFTVELPAAG